MASTNERQFQYTIRSDVTDARVQRKNIAGEYFILNYKEVAIENTFDQPSVVPQLSEEFPEKYNSVIFDAHTNKPLSIAPSSPIPLDAFTQKHPTITGEIYVSEINEGTLVQLFYNERSGIWEIATRSSVGGNNRHYRTEYSGCSLCRQKTFRQMFYDALVQVTPVAKPQYPDEQYELRGTVEYHPEIEYYDAPLSEIPFVQTLPKQYCYNFILSHPSNPLLRTVFIPQAILVAVYELELRTADEYAVWMIPPYHAQTLIPEEYKNVVRVQEPYNGWVTLSLREKMMNHEFYSWMSPGLMVTNVQTGERAMLENPQYKYASELRGNHMNLQVQFFELWKSGKLSEFLAYFPIFNTLFMHFYNQYIEFTFRVYSVYVYYYIDKQRNQFFEHAYHKYATKFHHDVVLRYIDEGNPGIFVTRELVQQYFDTMPTLQIVNILSKVFL